MSSPSAPPSPSVTGEAKASLDTECLQRPRSADQPHARAIFLHTGWRSAGTWVWSRLRLLDTVTALYEPLSNILSDLTVDDIGAFAPTYNSGHPPLEAPYYNEYRPFIREGSRGVIGYRKYFGIDRFGHAPDGDFPALQSYLHTLCERTQAAGKVPVFKFCRSSGRLPWLQRAFPDALHAVVLRNPAAQFASGWLLNQQWNNPFFVAAPFRVLGLNQTEPIVRQVIDLCEVRLPPAPSGAAASADEYAAICEQFARTVEGANAYRAFIALWILCAVRICDDVDLVIDMDRLGQSPAYADSLRASFHRSTGLNADFGGARDLMAEAARLSTRIKGIDGWSTRAIHAAAQKFARAQNGSSPLRTNIAALVDEKLAAATDLSAQWR
jgi:hypothetical protein